MRFSRSCSAAAVLILLVVGCGSESGSKANSEGESGGDAGASTIEPNAQGGKNSDQGGATSEQGGDIGEEAGTTGIGGKPSNGGSTGIGGKPSNGGSTGIGGKPSNGGTAGAGGDDAEGGSGVGGNSCGPVAACNWCGGETETDSDGCITGFRCANGTDPCSTNPCEGDEDCADNESCGDGMLCWPDTQPDSCQEPHEESGYVYCKGGWNYRKQARDCTSHLPREATLSCLTGGCVADTDCTEEANGYCSATAPDDPSTCSCQYGCLTDDDCGSGKLCACQSGVGVGKCITAGCRTDDDCTEGNHCASTTGILCDATDGYACQTDADQCLGNDDCSEVFESCQYSETGRSCESCAVP